MCKMGLAINSAKWWTLLTWPLLSLCADPKVTFPSLRNTYLHMYESSTCQDMLELFQAPVGILFSLDFLIGLLFALSIIHHRDSHRMKILSYNCFRKSCHTPA
jgi:hypothetical protein